MAEEVKETKEVEKTDSDKIFKTVLKVVLGLVLLVLGAYLIVRWKWDIWTLIKGCAGPFLILAGVIALAIAKE